MQTKHSNQNVGTYLLNPKQQEVRLQVEVSQSMKQH